MGGMRLSDEQWDILKPLIPKLKVRKDGKGRPWRDNREVLEGVLWVLKTGSRWRDLPQDYPSYPTCFRRFQAWNESGVIDKILKKLSREVTRSRPKKTLH